MPGETDQWRKALATIPTSDRRATVRPYLAAAAGGHLDSAGVAGHRSLKLSCQEYDHAYDVRPRLVARLRPGRSARHLPAGTAGAASWWEMKLLSVRAALRGRAAALRLSGRARRIASRFNQKEDQYWNSDLKIVNFEQLRETAFRSWAANTIPRRFCSGIVEVSDGRKHPIHYTIAEDTGMIGASWGVEWCVVGLDRKLSYNPACKMAKP